MSKAQPTSGPRSGDHLINPAMGDDYHLVEFSIAERAVIGGSSGILFGCLVLPQILQDPLLMAVYFAVFGCHLYKWSLARPKLNWVKDIHEKENQERALVLYTTGAKNLSVPAGRDSAHSNAWIDPLAALRALVIDHIEKGYVARPYQLLLTWPPLLHKRVESSYHIQTLPDFIGHSIYRWLFLPGGPYFTARQNLEIPEMVSWEHNIYHLFISLDLVWLDSPDDFDNHKLPRSRLCEARFKGKPQLTISLPKIRHTLVGFKKLPNRIHQESSWCEITGAEILTRKTDKDFKVQCILKHAARVFDYEGRAEYTDPLLAAFHLRQAIPHVQDHIEDPQDWECNEDEFLDIAQIQTMFKRGSDSLARNDNDLSKRGDSPSPLLGNDVLYRIQEEFWYDNGRLPNEQELQDITIGADIATTWYLNKFLLLMKHRAWKPELDDLSQYHLPHDAEYEYFDADEEGMDPDAPVDRSVTEDEEEADDDFRAPIDSVDQFLKNLLPLTGEEADETVNQDHGGLAQKRVRAIFKWIGTYEPLEGDPNDFPLDYEPCKPMLKLILPPWDYKQAGFRKEPPKQLEMEPYTRLQFGSHADACIHYVYKWDRRVKEGTAVNNQDAYDLPQASDYFVTKVLVPEEAAAEELPAEEEVAIEDIVIPDWVNAEPIGYGEEPIRIKTPPNDGPSSGSEPVSDADISPDTTPPSTRRASVDSKEPWFLNLDFLREDVGLAFNFPNPTDIPGPEQVFEVVDVSDNVQLVLPRWSRYQVRVCEVEKVRPPVVFNAAHEEKVWDYIKQRNEIEGPSYGRGEMEMTKIAPLLRDMQKENGLEPTNGHIPDGITAAGFVEFVASKQRVVPLEKQKVPDCVVDMSRDEMEEWSAVRPSNTLLDDKTGDKYYSQRQSEVQSAEARGLPRAQLEYLAQELPRKKESPPDSLSEAAQWEKYMKECRLSVDGARRMGWDAALESQSAVHRGNVQKRAPCAPPGFCYTGNNGRSFHGKLAQYGQKQPSAMRPSYEHGHGYLGYNTALGHHGDVQQRAIYAPPGINYPANQTQFQPSYSQQHEQLGHGASFGHRGYGEAYANTGYGYHLH